MRTDKLTLQTILQMGSAAYERQHPLPDYVRRAVRAILACRTGVLGGHVQAGPEGHVERLWYNSCRHRLCPQCAWGQVERWLAKRKGRLLAWEHYQVIFTLPHELNDLWLANVGGMTQVLFDSVHETLVELLEDGKFLGAQPGIIAALHTWSQTLLLYPHVHCLVTGGGMTAGAQWVPLRSGFLLPMRLPLAQFIGRWRPHVPPPGAVLVRCWGLYAHTQGAALAMCRQQLGQGPVEGPRSWDWQSVCAERGEAPPECCVVCGQRLVGTAIIPRAGVPPPAAADGKQGA